MKRVGLILLIALCAWIALPVRAAVNISVGTIVVPPGTASVSVPIYVTGGDAVTDCTAYFQIGDGGVIFGGTNGPKIIGFDFTGSIWANAPGGFTQEATFTGSGTPTQLEELVISLDAAGETVAASGLLCRVLISTTGFTDGSFNFAMKNVYPPGNVTSTEFGNGGAEVTVNITNGSLQIGGLSVPVVPQVLVQLLAAGTMQLLFDSESGVNYTIQWNGGLVETDWESISPSLAGTGGQLSWTDDGTQTGTHPNSVTARFYRVLAE